MCRHAHSLLVSLYIMIMIMCMCLRHYNKDYLLTYTLTYFPLLLLPPPRWLFFVGLVN